MFGRKLLAGISIVPLLAGLALSGLLVADGVSSSKQLAAAAPCSQQLAHQKGYMKGTEWFYWASQPNATGYRLCRDGTAIATAGAAATSAKFVLTGTHDIGVEVITAPPPTTSTTTTTTTPTTSSTTTSTTIPTTSTTTTTTTTTPPGEPAPIAGQGYTVSYDDEFNSTADLSGWTDHIWYDPSPPTGAVSVTGGALNLTARKADGWQNITATTLGSHQFTYGYFEAKMKWSKGNGSWPAFWMMGTPSCTDDTLGKLCPELDIMEMQGSQPNILSTALHRNTGSKQGVNDQTAGNCCIDTGVDTSADWHTYSALWTPTSVTWYFDNRQVATAPTFDSTNQPMFLLFDMWLGGWTKNVDSTTPPTLTTQVDWVKVWQKPTGTGQLVWLSPSGNDSTCVRNDRAHPCATFKTAFTKAQPGDSIAVHGGSYPADPGNQNWNQLLDAKSGTVTFVCAGDGNVNFQAPNFMFWAGAANAAFQGDCFHFHAVTVGLGGYPQLTHDITLDGVHLDSFEIIGAKNITIKNSEIGPLVACGAADAPVYAACDSGSYYAQFPHGTDVIQQEPFIHNGSAGRAINVTLDHDTIHGITSKWTGTHTGGLLIWNTDNLHITNTIFADNAVYDIEQNASSTDNGLLLQNNTFGYPVLTSDAGTGNNGHREVECCGSGDASNNWLIDHNTFVNGIRIDAEGSKNGFVVSNNKLGSGSDCGRTGVTYTGNDHCG